MKYLQEVSTEGGPLLIADAALARSWRGIEGDNKSDYTRACKIFESGDPPGGAIPLGSGQAVVWDMEGPGVADVFAPNSTCMIIVRAWLDNLEGSEEFDAVEKLAHVPIGVATELGILEITSGVLAILWAAEDGECIESLDIPEDGRPTGKSASEASSLLIGLHEGRYSCLHDYVHVNGNAARRCHIVRQ